MFEFARLLCTAAVCLAIGLAMFRAIDWAIAGRRFMTPPAKRMAILVFGAVLLVLGVVWMLIVMTVLVVSIYSGKLSAREQEQIAAVIAADILLSLVPIGGALLLSVGTLLGRERTPDQLPKLYRRLDGLSVIAWCWLSLAIVIACLATIGGSPLFAIILAVIVLRIRYGSQQNGLVWVLAIAAEKKLPLAAAVEEYGAECRGGYQRRVLQFADRLLSGQSLPAAIEADRQSWFSRALRRYWIFTDYVNPTIPLLPAPARVAASVGWETGTLGPALREIALARTLNRPDWHAALGRLMLLMLPLVILQHVGGFVLFFIAPKFKRIFYDFGVELPPITKIVYQVGDEIIEGNALPIVLLFELIIGVFLLASLRSAWSFWTHFPVDRLLRGLDRAVILRSLAVSVDGGQTLTVGLRALASCYPKNWVRRRLARAIEGTELGSPWAQCLGSHRLIRRADVTLLESAQRAGNLGWALRELAARAERRLAYALQLFVHVLYPVIFLGVAGLIFLFVVGYFSPLLKLIRELSG